MLNNNFDPYDMLMNLDLRVQMLEQQLHQIQQNQVHIGRMLSSQTQAMKEAARSNKALADMINIHAQIIGAK